MAKKGVVKSSVKSAKSQYGLFNTLIFLVILATLTTFPFIFDSFTVSKLLILAIGLTFITFRILTIKNSEEIRALPKYLLICVTMFVLSLVLSWSQSGVPLLRGLFGQFGRGNGLFYYFFVILIFIFSIKTFKASNSQKMHQLITQLSWFLSIYAALQNFGIDIAKLDTKDLLPVVLTFGNSNFAGGMLAVLFSYHFIDIVVKKKVSFKEGTLLVALLVSSTFSAAVQGYLIILFSIATGVSIWITQKLKTPIASKLLIAGWILGIVTIILGLFGKFIFAPIFARSSFQIRIEYWKISLEIIRDFPLFGIGPDKLYDVTSNYMSPGSLKLITTTRLDNAHNWFLNLGANFGLISLVLLIILLSFAFYASTFLLRKQNQANPVSVASAMAFVAMFIDGLVSIEQPGLGLWMYFFAGVAIASWRELSESSIPGKTSQRQNSELNSFTLKIVNLTLLIGLLVSSLAITHRIYFDGVLRSNVQAILLNKGSIDNLLKIESAALNLKSEPEYSVYALDALSAVGEAQKIDLVSEAFYNYYPDSIQANLIRADVLRALNRQFESCPLLRTLIENMPWDLGQLEKYIACFEDNPNDPTLKSNLIRVIKYFSKIDLSEDIPPSSIASKLTTVSVQARTYYIIGLFEQANQSQSDGQILLQKLLNAKAFDSTLVSDAQVEYFKKLLDF